MNKTIILNYLGLALISFAGAQNGLAANLPAITHASCAVLVSGGVNSLDSTGDTVYINHPNIDAISTSLRDKGFVVYGVADQGYLASVALGDPPAIDLFASFEFSSKSTRDISLAFELFRRFSDHDELYSKGTVRVTRGLFMSESAFNAKIKEAVESMMPICKIEQ